MRITLLALALLLSTTTAQASTRSYFSPKADSHPISACLADGVSCGKQAADAFCKKQGFTESILFARETVTSARVLDSGLLCEGGSCEAFKRIKCYQPNAAASSILANPS